MPDQPAVIAAVTFRVTKNTCAAEAFYDDAWHADVFERFGNSPGLTCYETAAMADGIEQRLDIHL